MPVWRAVLAADLDRMVSLAQVAKCNVSVNMHHQRHASWLVVPASSPIAINGDICEKRPPMDRCRFYQAYPMSRQGIVGASQQRARARMETICWCSHHRSKFDETWAHRSSVRRTLDCDGDISKCQLAEADRVAEFGR